MKSSFSYIPTAKADTDIGLKQKKRSEIKKHTTGTIGIDAYYYSTIKTNLVFFPNWEYEV